MQSFLSCGSCSSWFTSQTVDWAEAKLPSSQQKHLARQAATLALAIWHDRGGGKDISWQEYFFETRWRKLETRYPEGRGSDQEPYVVAPNILAKKIRLPFLLPIRGHGQELARPGAERIKESTDLGS